jgi:hypothetical protein
VDAPPEFPEADKQVVRGLACALAEVAALPVQRERADLWRRLNRLEDVRPMVHIWSGQTPWHEFDEEWLRPQTTHPFAREVETRLRRTLYQWRHFPSDMVVEARVCSPLRFSDTGYGLPSYARRPAQKLGAGEFEPLINEPRDLDKIKTPRITPDAERTERDFAALRDAIGDIVKVEKQGVTGPTPAVWDMLIRWYGIERLMTDMLDRPALVHAAIARTVDATLARLRQFEELGLLALNNGNHLATSGGLMFSDELPAPDFAGTVRAKDMWGNQMAQIFSAVSPAMHDEFALTYEIRILERFGLNGYGCCEPLDRKVHLLHKIPRLKRVSMSPWVDWDAAAQALGRRYIFSAKPNPAWLAADAWNVEPARNELRRILDATRGLHVELILKDIHTLRGEPRRLREWAAMAAQVVDEYA